jgi:hypothetical protein
VLAGVRMLGWLAYLECRVRLLLMLLHLGRFLGSWPHGVS